MIADEDRIECAIRCRQLAMRTYELADEAEHPYVIDEYLRLAAKLIACADQAERGEAYHWPRGKD